MPSVSIDIDVDLDDFSTDDLAYELYERLDNCRKSHRQEKLMELIKALYSQFFEDDKGQGIGLPVHSVLDEMKVEYMKQVFEKYTLTQIEAALPL